MRKLLLPLVSAFFLLQAGTPAFAAAQESIAAIVNDSVITITDIHDRTALYLSGGQQDVRPEQRKKVEQQVLSRLIDESLQMQEAQKMGITVAEEDVTAGFASLAGQNQLSPEDFKKRLAASGAPVQTLYNQIKAELAWSRVVMRKLRPQVNVSEGEIDLTLKQMSNGGNKPQYQVAEIFLAIPSPEKENEIREEAGKLVGQITQGASFANVAREFSQAPGAASGGDLGWVQEGQLDSPLDAALQKMQPGQVSPPIRSAKGYHILFLRDARQNGVSVHAAASAATATGPVISLKQIFVPVTQKDPPATISAKIARIKALQKNTSSCAAMDAQMKKFPSPNTGNLGKGPQDKLPKEIRAVVEPLKIGELSQPIRTPQGIVVMMVCSRDEAPAVTAETKDSPAPVPAGQHADGSASRDQIANSLGMKRLDQMASRYLHDLRATAFIDKRI